MWEAHQDAPCLGIVHVGEGVLVVSRIPKDSRHHGRYSCALVGRLTGPSAGGVAVGGRGACRRDAPTGRLVAVWRFTSCRPRSLSSTYPPKTTSTMNDAAVAQLGGSNGLTTLALNCSSRTLKPHSASEKIQKVSRTMKPISPMKRRVLSATRQRKSVSAAENASERTLASPQMAAGRMNETTALIFLWSACR